jgi:hypothetical protein
MQALELQIKGYRDIVKTLPPNQSHARPHKTFLPWPKKQHLLQGHLLCINAELKKEYIDEFRISHPCYSVRYLVDDVSLQY